MSDLELAFRFSRARVLPSLHSLGQCVGPVDELGTCSALVRAGKDDLASVPMKVNAFAELESCEARKKHDATATPNDADVCLTWLGAAR